MSTDRVQEYLSSIPLVTKTLFLFNIAVHIVLFVTSFPVNDLAINPLVILVRGEYYRMVSSAFVHGGLMHIAMNMSTLLAIGGSLESQYGTIPMLFLTLWCLLLCGATFVSMVWLYAVISAQPGELNTSAVGYSGVLFSYALIDAFHSVETSRSVFGLFSVPTKAYPFILLALIQVLMPNISFWGHLSGLLVGIMLISQVGVSLFMPSYECMVYLEQMVPCCRPLVLCGGYVPVRDKDLVHAYLRCGAGTGTSGAAERTGSASSSSCWAGLLSGLQTATSGICYAFVFVWQILAFLLTIIGVPAAALRRTEVGCASVAQCPRSFLDIIYSAYSHVAACVSDSCCCGGGGGGGHAYVTVQTAEPLQDDDVEQPQQHEVALGTTRSNSAAVTHSPMQQQVLSAETRRQYAATSVGANGADIAALKTKSSNNNTTVHYV